MNKNEIKITISGVPASGKSRMLYILKHILKEEGFSVEHKLNSDFNNEVEFNKHMEKNIEKIYEDFKNTKTIELSELSLNTEIV